MAMFDVFYRANLPSSYKYIVLRDNTYVLLDSEDTKVGYEFYPNVSGGAYQLTTLSDDEIPTEVETTDNVLGRPDIAMILLSCFIILVCFFKLFNFSTIIIQRGGVFSDL